MSGPAPLGELGNIAELNSCSISPARTHYIKPRDYGWIILAAGIFG